MAIEQVTEPYEVLFRCDPRRPIAAHVQSMRRLLDGDTVLSEVLLDAQPLATAGAEFTAVVGAICAGLAGERDAVLAQVASLQAQVSTITGERDAALAQVTALQAQLDAITDVPVPVTITAVQLRLALAQFGLLDAVLAWLEAQDAATRIRFEYATVFDLSDPLFDDARIDLGLSLGDFESLVATARSL